MRLQRFFVPIVALAIAVGGAAGWYVGRGSDSTETLATLRQENRTYMDQISTLKTQLDTAKSNADSIDAQKQQVQKDLDAARVQVQLLEDGLAIYASPHDLVVAYANAMKKRNGAVVRAYLEPAIKESVPPKLLGVSNPHISRFVIQSEQKGKAPVVETAVIRFYEEMTGQGELDYHDDSLTISKGTDGRYLISSIQPGPPVPLIKGK